MEWKNIYRGLLMGASDVVPGVSGGTIAVILGIYDRLIASVNGFFSKEWKRHLGFLVPLGIGIVGAVFALANLIEWLFEHYPGPTQFFFLGLIIGVLPFLFHKAEAKKTFKVKHVILLLLGAILVASIAFFPAEEPDQIANLDFGTYVYLFFAGFIASSAMILPGISGSLILLIIGAYTTITSAISNFKLDIIFVVGAGILIGIVVMSKIIHYFMARYPSATYALVIGLVIGSVAVVFPGWPQEMPMVIVSIVTFAAGLAAAVLLGRVEYE
ncbi:DUF368 domain-containing protein [Sediminibacillus dalangtanensis]|uniref:DUF368 domain-containing protein n=1 Tax=Sediminibacillus dalangtanensis TaxID=2729421 RepID=A0ABX7VNE2_9BACI|nr:DUF368 domain-containing protein [Sediminibacillus dalangtanensis]QTM98101.1 DUF368 domain-containing protein [Sediminibacillus dalangtanensis]